MNVLTVNCGNFSSLENFYQSVGISNPFDAGDNIDQVVLDCRLFNRVKNVRLSVLTAFLALAYNLKEKYNREAEILLTEDYSVLQFLKNTNVYLISKDDKIINWSKYEDGGKEIVLFRENIYCKIISFRNFISEFSKIGSLSVVRAKNHLMDLVPFRILDEFSSILSVAEHLEKRFIIRLLNNTISEYVINAIVHGKSAAYLGLQLSRGGISVCISDSGIGMLKSLQTNYNSEWANRVGLKSDMNAILNASLKQNLQIGLRDTISSVAEVEGFTVISSGSAFIVWGAENWNEALHTFDHENYHEVLQDYKEILNKPLGNYYSVSDMLNTGGYKIFDVGLPGTRIYFEIPFGQQMTR